MTSTANASVSPFNMTKYGYGPSKLQACDWRSLVDSYMINNTTGLKKLVPLTDQEMLMVWQTVDEDHRPVARSIIHLW